MLYKKIVISLFLLIGILPIVNSVSEIYLDSDNYCAGYEVTFTIWNKTQWDNRETLEDEQIDKFEDVDVVVYDGPIASLGVLYEGQTNNLSEFSTTFNREDEYLIEIEGSDMPGNFTNYEKRTYIDGCKYAGDNRDVEVEEQKSYSDVEYSFANNNVAIQLDQTNTSKDEISFSQLQQEDVAVNERIENVASIYEIQYPQEIEYSDSSISFSQNSQNPLNLYKYNQGSLAWDVVEKNISTPYTLNSGEQGTYALQENIAQVQNEQEAINESSQVSSEEGNTPQNQTPQGTPVIENTSNSSSTTLMYVIGAIVVLGVIASPFLFRTSKRKKQENLHPEKLATYKEEYEKTKNYVQQYKDQFSQEAIRQALLQGNIPVDIIDKVFREVYET